MQGSVVMETPPLRWGNLLLWLFAARFLYMHFECSLRLLKLNESTRQLISVGLAWLQVAIVPASGHGLLLYPRVDTSNSVGNHVIPF